jgi:uncharacterized protein involved in exopolysaccharide biosynthesis
MKRRFSQMFLELIKGNYRYIIFVVVTVTIFAIILSFLLPHTYEASGLFTPVLGTQSPYSTLVDNLRFRMLDVLFGSSLTVSDVYASILRSRCIQSEAINKCKYKEIYNIKYMDDAIQKFERDTNIEVGFEGFITVNAKARSPELAAQMVNGWIRALDGFLQESAMSGGSKEKKFIQEQLLHVRAKLSLYKDSLSNFLIKHKLIESVGNIENIENVPDLEFSLNSQVNTSLGIYYKLLQDLIEIETALALYSKIGEHLPLVQEARLKRSTLKSAMEDFVFRNQNGFGPGFSFPLIVTPKIQREYEELRRSVNLYSVLEELLSAYCELYRITESRDISLIEVVDWADPPQKRIWPNRGIMVLAGFGASLLISILICLSHNYKEFL